MSRAGSLGLARRPEKKKKEDGAPPRQGTKPLGPEGEAKGAGRASEATRAGLPGRRGTRRASAAAPGEQETPTRGRRPRICPPPRPRGAGNEERPRPEGLVPRGRPDRTRPAAPPSCLLSLPPTRGPLSRGRPTHQRLHLSPPLPPLLPAPPQPPPPPPRF